MTVRELVVVSGKGGTGKTSILASFAALSRRAILADCDVDAADLYLLLEPRELRREEFRAGEVASIRREACRLCGYCFELCRFGAVREKRGLRGSLSFAIDPEACEGCGVCADRCPARAIELRERKGGEWYVSETEYGSLVHARLEPGGENSGKLVKTVRDAARAPLRLALRRRGQQVRHRARDHRGDRGGGSRPRRFVPRDGPVRPGGHRGPDPGEARRRDARIRRSGGHPGSVGQGFLRARPVKSVAFWKR